MKVPPKRKGNADFETLAHVIAGLNESPSEKEGKWRVCARMCLSSTCLNESPSEKEGKCAFLAQESGWAAASMKVPPKRKGNPSPNERNPEHAHSPQ